MWHRPSDAPGYIEAITVYGRAVERGAIPLTCAADILAMHPLIADHSGLPPAERFQAAAEDLLEWKDVVVEMEWPGDEALDAYRWDKPLGWELVEYLNQRGALPVDDYEDPLQQAAQYARAQIDEINQQTSDPGACTSPDARS
jgi:hypothetical protein